MMKREKREGIQERRLREEIEAKKEEEKNYFNFKARPMSTSAKVEKMDKMKQDEE